MNAVGVLRYFGKLGKLLSLGRLLFITMPTYVCIVCVKLAWLRRILVGCYKESPNRHIDIEDS